MQDYLKNCLFLIFDAALFYSNNAEFKPDVVKILQSPQVHGLIETIRRYQDKPDIKELILFIEDKPKFHM